MIETDRLILRPWIDSDRDGFVAMCADPEVTGTFPGVMSARESNDLVDHFIACWAEDGFSYGAIERRADGAFIGMGGLAWCRFQAPLCPCFEMGWALARPWWGQGFATEAARAWAHHGFTRLDIPEIVAFTDPANARSLAVMHRLGMRREAAPLPDTSSSPHPQALCVLPRALWRQTSAALSCPAATDPD